MATLLELQGPQGIGAGREVISVLVLKREKAGHITTIAPGTKSASTEYSVDVLRVEEPLRAGACEGATVGVFTLLASNDPKRTPGSKVTIDGRFKQFVGGADDPTAQGLARDGVTIDVQRGPEGNVTGVNVVQGEVFTWQGEKHLPYGFGLNNATSDKVTTI